MNKGFVFLLLMISTCFLKAQSTMDTVSYSLGVLMAQNLKKQGFEKVDVVSLARAISDVVEGKKLAVDQTTANKIVKEYQRKKLAAVGESFLAENGKREGVFTTASGLQYEILKQGEGPKPGATQKVSVHYHGTLVDGTVFDSSVERGRPASFGLNQVIKGWTEGLQLMNVGSKYKFYIPYQLGYGERGAGGQIGPYSALIFEVELLEIK